MYDLSRKFDGIVLPETGPEKENTNTQPGQSDFNSLFGPGESPEISPRDSGFSMPVLSHLTDAAKDKISVFGYIDFATMFPQEGFLEDEDEMVAKKSDQGEIVWGRRSHKVPIDSLEVWLKAFTIYSAVLLKFHPRLAVALKQYEFVIMRWSKVYPWQNVYSYDKAFRRSISKDPTIRWDRIDHDLAALELPKEPMGPNRDPYRQPNSKPGTGGKPQKGFSWPCRQYNAGQCAFGSACKFEHKCSFCHKLGHGANVSRKAQKNKKNDNIKTDPNTVN